MIRNKVAALALVVCAALAASNEACQDLRYLTLPADTVVVHDTLPPKVDTLKLTRVDTLTRYDTTWRRDTVPGPPVHDTTVVIKVDTVTRVDTFTQLVPVPGPVAHDTTWIYLQTNPTNPLAGGDPSSGLMILQVWASYYLTFWHGHFVGVVNYWYTDTAGNAWYVAYLSPKDGSLLMPQACTKPSLLEAVQCLEPLVLTLQMRVPKYPDGL